MKGYAVLILVVCMLLLMMPMMILEKPVQESVSQVQGVDVLRVRHTDSQEVSEISLLDLTLYETAAVMPADAPEEAIKAQALVSYTRLCYQRLTEGEATADIVETALPFPEGYSQAFWKEQWGESFDSRMNTLREAVSAVYGRCITYEDQPIMAVSHLMNTGITEDAQEVWGIQLPYLTSVASPADALATDQSQTVEIPLAEAKTKLSELIGATVSDDASSWFGDIQKTEANTVKSIEVCSKTVAGTDLQALFGLPSASFEAAVQNDTLLFTVCGQGHFVGMSVTGAIAMARDGHTCEEIVKHYFTGACVT